MNDHRNPYDRMEPDWVNAPARDPEEEIAALIAPGADFYPLDPDNLQEAIAESKVTSLAACLRTGEYETAGKLLYLLTKTYWQDIAEKSYYGELP